MTRPEKLYVVLGFASVHDAIAGEAALKADGLEVVSIPAPPELGDLCGIALRVAARDGWLASSILADAGVPPTKRVEFVDV